MASLWVSDLYTVEVDRLKPPFCPQWARRVLHPEYEQKRPSRYDLRKDVEPWLHHEQTLLTGGELGFTIYQYIMRGDSLSSHLSYADLGPIQEMGVEIYRQLYDDKSVVAWGGVVEGTPPRRRSMREGQKGTGLSVPYLCLDKGKIEKDWETLDEVFGPDDAAPRFREGVL